MTNNIRNLFLSATAVATMVLVSDGECMHKLAGKLAGIEARQDQVVQAPVVVDQVRADVAARCPVVARLLEANGDANGNRLGGGRNEVVVAKRRFHDAIVGVAQALIEGMQGFPGVVAGAATVDGDEVVNAAIVRTLLGFIQAVENAPNSAVNAAGVRQNRTLNDSYGDFIRVLEGQHTANGGVADGILHDANNVGNGLQGQARIVALLDHILDDRVHTETYFTNIDGAGTAHAEFAHVVANGLRTGGGVRGYHAELASNFVARWHLVRLVLEDHVAANVGLSFKSVRALAKLLGDF